MYNNFDRKKYEGNGGIGCGSVGRAVSSDVGDPPFEFCHWQNLLLTVQKTKINKKRPGKAHFKKCKCKDDVSCRQ